MKITSNPLTEQQINRLVHQRAAAKMRWYIHALVYVCVNLGLVLLAWQSGRDWRVYPLLGWGLGLALHGAAVWLLGPGSNLKQNLVARERARLTASR